MGKSFNDDMDRYLKKLDTGKSPDYMKKVIKKAKKNSYENASVPIIADEGKIHVEEYKSGWIGGLKKFFSFSSDASMPVEEETIVQAETKEGDEIVSELKEEYDGLEHMEEQIEERKDGIVNKLFGRIFQLKQNETHEDVLSPEDQVKLSNQLVDDDIRKILKITHEWLKKLPKRELTKFKESEDFEIYKSTLKKYNLIK